MNKSFYTVADRVTLLAEITKPQPGETIMNHITKTLGAIAAVALAFTFTATSHLEAAEHQDKTGGTFRAPGYQPVEPDKLRAEFPEPPMERRLRAWWFWVMPYVSSDGVTKDIAAMDRAGMGGAVMMTHAACQGIPKGWGKQTGATYNSDAYLKLRCQTFDDFAARGMQADIHNVDGYHGTGGPWVKLEQGQRMIRVEHLQVAGPQKFAMPWPAMPAGKELWGDEKNWNKHWPAVFGINKSPLPPGKRETFRDITILAVPGRVTPPNQVEINIRMLADRETTQGLLGREGTITADKIVHLDQNLAPDGTLTWDVPAGDWTILRFLSEPTGMWGGTEIDKWDRELFLDTVEKNLAVTVAQNKQNIGKSFTAVEQDSWESGVQTWSANMPEVFRQRRGYDLRAWLPVLAGVAVNSKEQSERFIWDLRRTIADQYIFVGYFTLITEWANQHGLQFSLEGIPIPVINTTEMWGVVDKPMDERWFDPSPYPNPNIKLGKTMAAAVADFHGRPLVAMEAFTDVTSGIYMEHPGNMKALGDSFLCAGWNQLIVHNYTSQISDEKPGHRLYGVVNNRSNTWWEQARPYFLSIGRAQTILQQLAGVADILYVEDETPNSDPQKRTLIESLFAGLMSSGFQYDACDAYSLAKLVVKDGKIVSPTGKRYQSLLYLAPMPPYVVAGSVGRVRPEILAELNRLAEGGVRIVSNVPRPTVSPSLANYPACDAKVAEFAAKLWDGGKIGKPADVAKGLVPDLEGHGGLNWTHRRSEKIDAYFLANHKPESVLQSISFRIAGKQPQRWHPETGAVEPILVWREENGRTIIPLAFDPLESYFVVFVDPASAPAPHWVKMDGPAAGKLGHKDKASQLATSEAGTWTLTDAAGKTTEIKVAAPPAPIPVVGPWTLTYPPGQDTPEKITLPQLQNMIKHPDPMVKGFSGTVTYRTSFTVPSGTLAKDLAFRLDLGDVQQLAEVKLNGKNLGIAYRNPYVIDATAALKEGENQLEIEVTNTWLNRMVIQKDLPVEKRLGDPSAWIKDEMLTRITGYTALKDQGYLMDSGLIGPVKITAAKVVVIK